MRSVLLSTQFHVFEITRHLPRFSMYDLATDPTDATPTGWVTFSINDRPQRVGCRGVLLSSILISVTVAVTFQNTFVDLTLTFWIMEHNRSYTRVGGDVAESELPAT